MLCCTSVLSSVLRSAALRLRRAVLCCAVPLCCYMCSDLRTLGLGELFCAVLSSVLRSMAQGLEELLYAVLSSLL